MKGLSWFGFETSNYGLYGLDVHNEDWYLQWMVDRVKFLDSFIKYIYTNSKQKNVDGMFCCALGI